MMTDVTLRMDGHVVIKDADTQMVLADRHNAINFEVASYAMALSLAHRPNGHIMQVVFGNGASSVSAVGGVTYLPPNITGMDAQLYNQTYSKFVDDLSPLNTDTINNFLRVNHALGNTYSDVVVTTLLDYNEPTGQLATDATDNEGTFVFDEIGIKTYDTTNAMGMMLSHVIFHPVQKSLNRRIEVIYTFRIVLS